MGEAMKSTFAFAVLFVAAATAADAQTVQLPVSERAGRLTVRVVDTASMGLPGAVVYLRSISQQPRLDVLSHSTVGTGLVDIDGLPTDRYKLIVSLPGFHESRQVVHVFPSDDQTIDVTLQVNPHGCVVVGGHGPGIGRIRDQAGRTLPRMAIVSDGGYWPVLDRVFADGTLGWCRPPKQFQEVAVVFEPVGRVVLKPAGTAATGIRGRSRWISAVHRTQSDPAS